MATSTELIDAAVRVLGVRYHLAEHDALDMLCISSRSNATSLSGLASWLVYDAEGNYYPEPDAVVEQA